MSNIGVENLDQKLQGLQDLWNEAPVGGSVPDGDYEGEIVDFDFFESNATPTELFLKTQIAIRLPREYDGSQVETIHSLSGSPERVGYAKEMLALLGVDVDSLNMGGLVDALREVIGSGVSVRVVRTSKNGRVYANVYVNSLLFPPSSVAPQQSQSDVPADMTGLPQAGQPAPEPVDPKLGF